MPVPPAWDATHHPQPDGARVTHKGCRYSTSVVDRRRRMSTTVPAVNKTNVIATRPHSETAKTESASPAHTSWALKRNCDATPWFKGLASRAAASYNAYMVTIDGKLLDPRHVELTEPVPVGEDSIQVRLINTRSPEPSEIGLLTRNPAFDFLQDEPDLYE